MAGDAGTCDGAARDREHRTAGAVRGVKFERRTKISANGKGKAQGGLAR
jgi:hypothetical protein